jgi:hypothetical protein
VYTIAQLDRPIFHIIAATEVSISMMPDEKYRITSPTIVWFLQEGDFVSQMIPDGTVITLEGATFNGSKLIDVVLEGKVVMMFTQDVRSRAVKIE